MAMMCLFCSSSFERGQMFRRSLDMISGAAMMAHNAIWDSCWSWLRPKFPITSWRKTLVEIHFNFNVKWSNIRNMRDFKVVGHRLPCRGHSNLQVLLRGQWRPDKQQSRLGWTWWSSRSHTRRRCSASGYTTHESQCSLATCGGKKMLV